jgi:hypothetical protein
MKMKVIHTQNLPHTHPQHLSVAAVTVCKIFSYYYVTENISPTVKESFHNIYIKNWFSTIHGYEMISSQQRTIFLRMNCMRQRCEKKNEGKIEVKKGRRKQTNTLFNGLMQ